MNRPLRVLLGVAGAAALVVLLRVTFFIRDKLPDDSFDLGPRTPAVANDTMGLLMLADSLRGRSGALRFAALTVAEAEDLPGLLNVWSDTILEHPRIIRVPWAQDTFALMLMRPFADKEGEWVGTYRLGWWPAERWMMASNYFNPDGFVEVRAGEDRLWLSTHFRLGDFLTHDQDNIWPKYLVLEERLIDKLELVAGELERRGINAGRMVVLSGFRAPYYNDRRFDEGAARASRHQFGDAADVMVDGDGDGRMDDLNGDGRFDLRDARVIGAAVSRVEQRYPELVGGTGTYAASGPSGAFAHVDVRGTSARWEREAGAVRKTGATGSASLPPAADREPPGNPKDPSPRLEQHRSRS